MTPVRFNPSEQRLIIELTGRSGRLETRKWRIFTILMLVFSVFLFTSPMRVLAERAPVVVVGSTGVIDESDLTEYEVRNQFATIKDSVVGPVTVTYRYNLPGVYNFQDSSIFDVYKVRIRYRDTGDTNQNVTVRLRAANLATADGDGVTTIYTFDSDFGGFTGLAAPNSTANQTFDECDVVLPADHLTHGRYGYFLEVVITKISNDGTPSPGLIGFVMSDASGGEITCGSV